MKHRKRLTGHSAELCFKKYQEIKDNPLYSETERIIARLWLVEQMNPKQISESGMVISKRNTYMSEDMIVIYINKLFPDIEYLETPTKTKRVHDKQHMRNMWELRKGLKGAKCAICGADATRVDHIIPVANGGSDHPDNIQYLCKACDKEKTRKERESGSWYINRSIPEPIDVKALNNKQISLFD